VIIVPYLHHVPRIAGEVSGHPTAAVIGRVELGVHCSLGPLATVRGDGERIRVGSDCWLGPASTLHVVDGLYPTRVGDHVTLGSYALVHACTVHDGCVIGDGAVVMDQAEVGAGALVAADSLVAPGKKLPGGWLYAGVPAQPVQAVSEVLREQWHRDLRGEAPPGARSVVRSAAPVALDAAMAGVGVDRFQGASNYVAPTASLAGHIVLGPDASIWFGSVLQADEGVVEIGEGSNIQDNSRLHAGEGSIRIGARVTVGHNVRLQACAVEDGAIIGMGSVIARDTVVRAGGCVAACAVTEPGTVVEPGWIWSGRPARRLRELSPKSIEQFRLGVQVYIGYTRNYLRGAEQAALRETGP
jgi:carbonic anhydrase/acetyltransferase-like protein (isoleucine patch superfamily)